MALIKCPECGKEISDKALACPGCGYPINEETIDIIASPHRIDQPVNKVQKPAPQKHNIVPVITIIITILAILMTGHVFGILLLLVALILSIISIFKGKTAIWAAYTVLLLFLMLISLSKFCNTDDPKETKSTAQQVNAPIPMETPASQASGPIASTDQVLSEDEYKALCEELWYDDIFFSKESLNGKYVKLYLFIEEEKLITADDMIYDSLVSTFVHDHDLERTYYECGVLRQNTNSYVGGQIELFIPKDSNCLPDDFGVEKKIVLYGEIINYSTVTWDGYNECGVIPRYIEYQ